MADVFNLILHSNLFNFSIFLLIIIIICSKFDIPAVLENMRNKVVSEINNSKSSKEQSFNDLSAAKTDYLKIGEEIENISAVSKQKSESLSRQIELETEQKIKNIERNTQNILSAEQKNVTSSLISKLGLKSVEYAQNDIIEELKKNPSLHAKFIEDSISKLDEVIL